MSKKVAPPKSTGGGGFVFEDKVCAWFLAHMLADEPPFDPHLGRLERIDFQTRPDGWFLDDILLSLTSNNGLHRCALSIKSNTQFNVSTAPADFVRTAWEQFIHEGSICFNEADDYIGLITGAQSGDIHDDMAFLVEAARAGDPKLLPSRYAQVGWASETRQKLFKSFACPEEIAQRHGLTDADTGRLLARLQLLEFDFESMTSESKKDSIERCRRALRSQSLEEAELLWDRLLRLSSDRRPVAGCLTRRALISEFRGLFQLAIAPDYRSDWQRLEHLSSAAMDRVRDTIGDRVRLSRDKELDQLDQALKTAPGAVLVGRSGVGKSVVAKYYAERHAKSGVQCLWFDARSFDRLDLAAFEADLRLSHDLIKVMASTPDARVLLVLDGLDRLYNRQAFGIVATFARALQLDTEGTPWRVVITCQTQEWPRLQENMFNVSVPLATWPLVECNPVSSDALGPVWQTIPAAARLQYESNLLPLLVNLKVLDLIASHLLVGENVTTSGWVGESNVAQWFWETDIGAGDNGPSRARFATLLAERQAHELRPGISLHSFDVSELQPLESLVRDRICQRTEDDKIIFAHDLFGDWARLRILISKSDEIENFLSGKLDSPLWHRALRLYGVYLLEHIDNVNQWRATLFVLSKDADGVAADLLLEAVFFATNPLPLMEQVRADLVQQDGKFMRRLLGRFLAFATILDQRLVEIAQAEGYDDASIAALFRRPDWIYWPPMLRFLYDHRAECVAAAPVEVARVAELWLAYTPQNFTLRREAAELGLLLGGLAIESRREYSGINHEHRKQYYRAALMGAQELPDEVAAYALRVSERTQHPASADAPPTDPKLLPKTIRFDPRFDPDEPKPDPWADGPYERVDDDFQKVALERGILTPLIQTRPAVAREVILACLIKARRRFEWSNSWHNSRELDLDDGLRWYPSLYTHGPLLDFLKINFDEGLETIARLVDFASERWRFYAEIETRKFDMETRAQGVDTSSLGRMMHESRLPPGSVVLPLSSGERELIGDSRVYGWSAGLGNPPSTVTTALMALEQYFYTEIDEGRPIEDKAHAVLERSRSTAFLKVLCDIGKRQIALFEGPLRPLLATPEVYKWETESIIPGRYHFTITTALAGERFTQLAQAFHGMMHRSVDLREIAIRLFLGSNDMREYLADARQRWEQRLQSTPDERFREFLKQLIIGFKIENYRLVEHTEHGRTIINVRAQEQYTERAEEREAFEAQSFLMLLPTRCRQMIDSGTVLDGDQIEKLWNDIQESVQRSGLSAMHDGTQGETPANYLDDSEASAVAQIMEADILVNALTGAAAVFIRLHRKWLVEHPEKKKWCIDQIRTALLNPPQRDRMDVPESLADWTWDCFAAEALPILWVEDPNNSELRQLMVRLVFTYHYIAVKILFKRCAEHRVIFGADFDRLRRLVFEWAYIRMRSSLVQEAHYSRGSLTEDEVQRFYETVDTWANERATTFIEGRLPLITESWSDMDHAQVFGPIDKLLRERFGSYSIDFRLVHAAHDWLPTIAEALNEQERQEWLGFWRASLTLALSRVTEDDEHRNYLYEDDRWVIDRVAEALPLMMPQERPENFWHPILDLPSDAHDWVESFLQSFHRVGLQKNPVDPRFATLRAAIIRYALGNGDRQVDAKWPYHDEVWQALIGIDNYTRSFWEPRHRELVEQSRSILERWMLRGGSYKHHLAAFAVWLEKDAADPIRLPGLIWLDSTLTGGNTNGIHNQASADDAVASLLHVVWQKDESRLRLDSESFAAFQRLLRWLTDRQNRLALELVRVVGRL